MLKNIVLTIDDAPSIHTKEKIDFLKKNQIPALFYARGEFVAKYADSLVYAIQNGFLIGNHSYSHPYFSQITEAQCREEITQTETLIDACYEKAERERTHKVVRLPFADRGAGPYAAVATNEIARQKVESIQAFLKNKGFGAVGFQRDGFVDSFWDCDPQDYKSKYILDPILYEENLKKIFDECSSETAIFLLHDFDHNHHLFEVTMRFFMERDVVFLDFQF